MGRRTSTMSSGSRVAAPSDQSRMVAGRRSTTASTAARSSRDMTRWARRLPSPLPTRAFMTG